MNECAQLGLGAPTPGTIAGSAGLCAVLHCHEASSPLLIFNGFSWGIPSVSWLNEPQ
jgi:hypothetical protein